jgi:DNA-binding LacI/PurR family transcriptional regulator
LETGSAPCNQTNMDRKATINDVAKLAGVSKKTVSLVVNHSGRTGAETRNRVERAIAELGYAPDPSARALGRRRSATPSIADAHPHTAHCTGMARAAAQLAAWGHTRIGLVTGPDDDPESRACELGYLGALADIGLDRGPSLIAAAEGTSAEAGRKAAELLLSVSPRPSAILASSDMLACGVLRAAYAAAIAVPGDLSITGMGDSDLAIAAVVPLSSVRLPEAELVLRGSIAPYAGGPEASASAGRQSG